MTKHAPIHWHEGQFLQPHLFQVQQRQDWLDRAEARRLMMPYAYGVVESEVSQDALEAKRVKFTRLRAVMPSGLLVELGRNMDLPDLDIAKEFAVNPDSFVIRLGVPLYQPDKPNTIGFGSPEDWRARKVYREAQVEVADDNTGDNPQTISTRKVNARLMFEREDTTDIEWLPLLRVKRQTGPRANFPLEDRDFYPTCLVANASEQLRAKLDALATDVGKCREEIVRQVSPGYNVDMLKTRQIVQMMRLQTLNRFSVRTHQATAGDGLPLFELYLLLREFHGELAALSPDRDPFTQAPAYNHDRPALWYDDLDRQIRKMLLGELPNKFRKVELRQKPPTNWYYAELGDKDSFEAKAYYIGIKTKMDIDTLRKTVQAPEKFKLLPETILQDEVNGVKLALDTAPPVELPTELDLRYFRVVEDQSADNLDGLRKWKRILAEKKFGVRWAQGVDVKLSELGLYLVLP